MKSVAVLADIHNVNYILNNLAEGKGYYCKVVAAKSKNRNTDKYAEYGCDNGTYNNCNDKSQKGIGNNVLHAH